LKKVGFQIKVGAIPHFKKIQNIIKNHDMPKENISFMEEIFMKNRNKCSNKYQSKEGKYLYIKIKNTNRLREDNNETQKKNNKDCKNVCGRLF
jgi:hypothetical protein